MKGNETRERIFRAAMQLAARDGLMTLTLEKVAEESGLSKGGVIHHFATKEALLGGVIAHFTDQVEREMTRLVAEDPNPTFRWVRAMLRMMTDRDSDSVDGLPFRQDMERFMLSVLAATIHNPELVKPVQAIGQRLRGRLTSVPEEGIEQLMMWLAMDGLFLWQFVGLLNSDDPLIDDVHEYLQNRLQQLSTPGHEKSRSLRPRSTRKITKTKSPNVGHKKKSHHLNPERHVLRRRAVDRNEEMGLDHLHSHHRHCIDCRLETIYLFIKSIGCTEPKQNLSRLDNPEHSPSCRSCFGKARTEKSSDQNRCPLR